MASTNLPVCAYFLRNACSRGDSCRFQHTTPQRPAPMSSNDPLICPHFSRGNCAYGVNCRLPHPTPVVNAPTVICSYFSQGSCRFGLLCKDLHSEVPSLPNTVLSPGGKKETSTWRNQEQNKRSAFGPCRFYLIGQCAKGAKCPFPHPPSLPAAPSAPIPLFVPTFPTSSEDITPVCTFFVQGSCRKGRACPFTHTGSTAAPLMYQRSEHKEQSLPKTTPLNVPPCRFFARGTCSKEERCPHLHIGQYNPTQAVPAKAKQQSLSEMILNEVAILPDAVSIHARLWTYAQSKIIYRRLHVLFPIISSLWKAKPEYCWDAMFNLAPERLF